jgi:hypothetical protein
MSDVNALDKKTEDISENPKPKLWQRYMELEPIKRLDNEGRELLGKEIYLTEKRDGSNVSLWLDEEDTVHISSHNQEDADSNIKADMIKTPEYNKAIELLKDEKHLWHNDSVLYGELLLKISPTRIEPRKKNIHWILFDIFSRVSQSYEDYVLVYQKGYHFHIPVVRLVDVIIPTDLDDLFKSIEKYKHWCKRHRREGIVGKSYTTNVFFKEKIDLPKKPKLEKPQKSDITYPPMPEETILRALEHAIDIVGIDNWKDRSKTMPIVAQQLETEAKEHFFSTPRNYYQIYLDTLTDDKYKHL